MSEQFFEDREPFTNLEYLRLSTQLSEDEKLIYNRAVQDHYDPILAPIDERLIEVTEQLKLLNGKKFTKEQASLYVKLLNEKTLLNKQIEEIMEKVIVEMLPLKD